jgi:uncharacterized protein (DUF362 family)
MTVSIIKRKNPGNSVSKAINLCDGLKSLKSSDKVLIKPNLVLGANKKNFPPFGIVTTASIIDELVQVLLEKGCKDIAIGEGSIFLEEMGSNTTKGFEFSGINRVGKDYNDVKLIDFEAEEYEKVNLDGHTFKIAKRALEADFLINVPVLKTHGQAIVSLGMKNLKGCLKFSSKKRFHKRGNLEQLIALFNVHLKSHLTIIDGTYALENGPTGGPAQRTDLIIASNDVLEADMVGANVLGKNPSTIPHIKEFARLTKRDTQLHDIVVNGEKIEDVIRDVPCEMDFNRGFNRAGLKGIRVNAVKGDVSICSGCYGNMEYTHIIFAKNNPGMDVGNVEICIGTGAEASPSCDKIFLFGDCAIKKNNGLDKAVKIAGCPPKVGKYLPALMNETLEKNRARIIMLKAMIKMIGFKMGLYYEDIGLWEQYKSEDFDLGHFS